MPEADTQVDVLIRQCNAQIAEVIALKRDLAPKEMMKAAQQAGGIEDKVAQLEVDEYKEEDKMTDNEKVEKKSRELVVSLIDLQSGP